MERNQTTASRSHQHQTVLPMDRSSERTSQRVYIGACSPGPMANSKQSPSVSQLSSPSHLSTISINGHTNTFSSHRSIATDSSGFSSGASTTTNRRDKSRAAPNGALNNYNHLSLQRDSHLTSEQHEARINQIRNKLIEDLRGLEQLAAAAAEARQRDRQANGCQTISCRADKSYHQLGSDRYAVLRNGDSHQTTPASTLSRCSTSTADRGAEMDCTTLCRDEFSSFIDYNKAPDLQSFVLAANGPNSNLTQSYDKQHSDRAGSRATSSMHSFPGKQRRASSRRRRSGAPESRHKSVGPMLVGVHEYEAPRQASYLPTSSAFNSSSSSPSCSEHNLAFVSSSSEQNSSSFKGAGDSFDDFDDENKLDRESIGTGRQSRFNGIPTERVGREYSPLVTPSELAHCEAHVEENFSDDSSLPLDDRHESSQLTGDRVAAPSSCVELHLLSKGDDRLSEALDVYLRRVEALLKLANSDKSVSLNQLLDGRSSCDESNQLEVRDEFKTTFIYVPHSDLVQSKPKVMQELEIENINSAQTDSNDCDSELKETEIVRTNFGSNFEDLFASPQTSATLNWNSNSASDQLAQYDFNLSRDENNNKQRQHKPIDEQQCRLLERSLLGRWLELGSEEGDSELETSHYENLVKTIRRHMGEFVANYNAYKETMCHETSFARDWHENWLFATSTRKCVPLKRAHRLSDHSTRPTNETVGTCPSDEHFSSEPNGPELSPKRAKMMSLSGSFEPNELLNYSTLLINKYKPVKVTFVDFQESNYQRASQLERARTSRDEQQVADSNKWWHRIESWYGQQPEYLMELKQTFSQLSGQVNVCKLLLNDLLVDDQELSRPEVLASGGAKRARRSIEIKFATSFNSGRSQVEGQFLGFVAYGYVFELNRLRHYNCLNDLASYRLKLDACKKLILARIRSLCHRRAQSFEDDDEFDLVKLDRELTMAQDQRDRAQFLVKVSDFRANFAWPVIQFCAQVSGASPLRVSWFKVLDDGSELELLPQSYEDIEQKSPSSSRRANKATIKPHEWPLSMWAKYEFEYQNDWLSWYKFKRDMKLVVFEIRQPHPKHDMSHRFKCELENFYNTKTCEFKWDLASEKMLVVESVRHTSCTKRSADQAAGRSRARGTDQFLASRAANGDDGQQFGRVRLNKVELSKKNQEAGQAILRTWSQRTLNKRAPLVDGANCSDSPVALHDDGQMHAAQQLRTVGRLSAKAMNDCQFGTDYPYHPKSLRERLERNKLSPLLDSRRAGGKGTLRRTNVGSHDDDDDRRKRQFHDQTDERTGAAAATWAAGDDNEERNASAGFVALELVSEQVQKRAEATAGSLSSPLGSIPELNRPEDIDCGSSAGGQRLIGATFVRSSNRRPDNSPSSSRVERRLMLGEQSNQDNNNNNNEQETQQKGNVKGSNRTESKQADRTGHEPTPMPRQKPRGQCATGGTSEPRRQPLVELKSRNLRLHDQQHHHAEIRSKDSLSESINTSNHLSDVDDVANYSPGHDVRLEKTQPVSTWTRPNSTANCDRSAQVVRLSPDGESRTSYNQAELERSSLNLVQPESTLPSRKGDASSVKSLISRFNMI